MHSLRHYFGAKSSSSTHSLTALDEPKALQDAMKAAAMILNDDVEGAETELAKGNSPYHKLGDGVVNFLRAVLGFEQDIMKEASTLLGEAESAASEAQHHSARAGYKSDVYPPGSEYALCHAEAQLMAAVVGVLNESLTEAIKGFYRLRRAYITLQEISNAEARYIETHKANGSSTRPATNGNSANGSHKSAGTPDESDDEDDFVDAKEDLESKAAGLSLDDSPDDVLPAPALRHPIDLFIHTGTCLCFGILQLLLSLVPPTFSRLLSIVGFRGNRQAGLKMLWEAAEYTDHINGGIAALVLLDFYGNFLSFCDIVVVDEAQQRKRRALLAEMRKRYPNGKFWLLQQAAQLSSDHNIEGAISLLMAEGKSPLKQVEALRWFQASLGYLNMGEYEKCAEGFLKCVDLNNWSQGLYYYIAASCYIELYRAATEPALRTKYEERATELLHVIPTKTGKRRFMARQLPFDSFVARKYAKWTTRAEKLGCSIIDAVGASPAEEMVYFWGGNKKRNTKYLEAAMERVRRFPPPASVEEKDNAGSSSFEDEILVQQVLTGVLTQRLGRVEEARDFLLKHVASRELSHYKSSVDSHAEMWALPVGCYEVAVCSWEAYLALDRAGATEDAKDKELDVCRTWIDKVAKWEGYELDTRVGMKVRTGQETLRKLEADRETA